MRNFSLFMLIIISLISCSSESEFGIEIEISADNAGGSSYGYHIIIKDSLMEITLNESIYADGKFTLGRVKEKKEKKLSDEQLSKLSTLFSDLGSFEVYHEYDKRYVEGDWTYEVTTDKEETITVCSMFLASDELRELKNLIDYIEDLSPMEIELKGF